MQLRQGANKNYYLLMAVEVKADNKNTEDIDQNS